MKFLKGVVHLCGSVYRHRTFDRLYSVRRLCIASQKLAWWQIKGQSVHHTEALRKGEQKQDIMEGGQQEPPETSVDDTDDQSKKKPQFGTRFLTDPKNVFQHNAWDNVVWDNQQEAEARQKTEEQLQDALSPEQQELYEKEADLYWDKFYDQHQNRFFKDRHWLFTEFPELYSSKGNTLKPSTAELSKNDENKASASEGTLAASAVTNQRCNTNSKEQGDHTNDTRIPCTSVGSISSTASVVTSISDCSAEDVQQDPNATDCAAGDAVTSNSADDGEKLEPPKIQHIEKKACCDCVCSSTSESFPGESASFRILEVGCGVGNTVFPVLSTNNDPGLMVYCCDFSSTAVQLVKENRDYDPKRCHAFVWDITDEKSVLPFPPESLDIVIMIFVLSAIHPDKMQQAVDRLASCLKPGGLILLRDYGRYDMAQLRFKKGRCLAENFYVRGDGTRVYFFTQEEFRSMFQKAGLEEVQNLIDRRLQVNRGRQLKMYRVWIQCKYWKPLKGRQFVDNSDKASTAPLS